jgi:hypothetical protein
VIVWRKDVDPSLLEPQFRADLETLLAGSPFTWLVTSGHRSNAEQSRLWRVHLAGGPKAAPPGKSAHNYGLAVDVVPDGDTGKPGIQPDWSGSSAAWAWLAKAVDAHPRLRHGRHFGDSPHIQRVRWQDFTGWNTPRPPLRAA